MTTKSVAVHPTALLSVVDHYTRVAKGTSKRVVGTLLGETKADGVHVTSCFGLPFEEDTKDPRVWFVDQDYHETMFEMFKKVNPMERVVGWYSTGPKIRPCDLDIHELFRGQCVDENPVFVIVDVTSKETSTLPVKAYVSSEDSGHDSASGKRTFLHIPSCVAALEAEEVGVEHLLRDMQNATASTLAVQVNDRIRALKTLSVELADSQLYLEEVISGRLPHNSQILNNLQNIVNGLGGAGEGALVDEDLTQAFNVERNDSTLAVYLGAILRSTLALHNLIDNKLKNQASNKREIQPVAAPVGVTFTNSDNMAEASGA